jgi:hypothetical protein
MGHAFGYSCHGSVIKFVRKIGGRMIVRVSIEGGVCHHKGPVALPPEGEVVTPGDAGNP